MISKELTKFITARIDIKNIGNADNNIQILGNSDSDSKILYENWFKDETGVGVIIESIKSNLNLKLICKNDGELNISLKSKDIRDKNNHRFPIYIDYTEFFVNGVPIIDGHTLRSHDNPYNFKMVVKDGDIINIHLKWLPFNSNCELIEFEHGVCNFNNELKQLKNEFDIYKKNMGGYIESNNYLLNKLFIDFKQEPTQLMADLKSVCFELLSFVSNICKKYGLKWWLEYGNLIGAMRHENFVPWDDDVDIGMMRQDYNKLNEVIIHEINKYGLEDLITIVYRKRNIDNESVGSFLQILIFHKIDGKRLLLAGVDVFPFDFIIDYKDMDSLNKMYYDAEYSFYRNLSKNIDYDECIKLCYEDLNCTYKKTDMVIPGVEGPIGPVDQYPLHILDVNKLFPLKLRKFSNKMFPCPKDSDYRLKLIYGDYMKIPKVIHHHGRVERFRYVKNTHKDFTRYVKILKNINGQFDEYKFKLE